MSSKTPPSRSPSSERKVTFVIDLIYDSNDSVQNIGYTLIAIERMKNTCCQLIGLMHNITFTTSSIKAGSAKMEMHVTVEQSIAKTIKSKFVKAFLDISPEDWIISW